MDRSELEDEVRRGLREFDGELDVLEQVVSARLGMSRTDGRALEIIDRRPGITPGELARALGYTPSAITIVINRLETGGLVSRRISEQDRRRLSLEPTRSGQRMVRGFMTEFGVSIGAILAGMSDADLGAVQRFLAACTAATATYRRQVSERDPTP